MRQTHLHSNWVFANASAKPVYDRTAVQDQPWLPATVPGYVHLDLADNGVIEDPFFRMNELGSRWVDECDWTYRTVFEFQADASLPRRVLRFEGLDTVSEIYLNQELIGYCDNMFLPLELEVTEKLLPGRNELEVRFRSAVRVGDERRTAYFEEEGLPLNLRQFDERAFVRKAQYMSGWDWGPRLISCGIWRPVTLLEFASRIKGFSVLQSQLEDGSFRVWTETEVEGSGEVTLRFGDFTATSHSSDLKEIDTVVNDPHLWWPNGMGDQHLYEASAAIEDGERVGKKVGLRTISLDRSPDSVGEKFTFLINGKPLWARGANWIPNDSFPSRVSESEYRYQIESCRELGMNMLRVWGGGLYELDAFYDVCDETGILVWQDFPYACSYYPDGEKACAEARREAQFQVKRLRDRAALALWCGNNENLTMWQGKWGGELSPPRYYGENIYEKVLPEVVSEMDPTRSYIPTSPIGEEPDGTGNANQGRYGDSHYWDVWHGRGDWIHYQDSDTRFSSEFGFASSCSMEMWDISLEEADRSPESPAVRWHNETGKGWDKFLGYVTQHYPGPKSLDEWVYYSQLNQRDALRFGIEHWRRAEICQGTLIWQFNDCWPVQSWAVQDYLRLLKPAGFELRRLYANQMISLVPQGSALQMYAINDGQETWDAEIELTFISSAGVLVKSLSVKAQVKPGDRSLIHSESMEGAGLAVVRASGTGISAHSMVWGEPKHLELNEPQYTITCNEDTLQIHVSGIAVDMIAVDVDNPFNLSPEGFDLSGASAQTLVNESANFAFSTRPRQIKVRSLHGEKVLATQ